MLLVVPFRVTTSHIEDNHMPFEHYLRIDYTRPAL